MYFLEIEKKIFPLFASLTVQIWKKYTGMQRRLCGRFEMGTLTLHL